MRQELISAPQEFRRILVNAVKKNVGTGDVALMFGGGTDAACIAFALMELGIKPTLYTFHLEDIVSEDLIASKKFADHFNLKHILVAIKRDPSMLIDDVLLLMNKYNCLPFPTDIQCSQPFLRILPLVKEETSMIGFGIDEAYGMTRFASQTFRNDPVAYHAHLKHYFSKGQIFMNGSEHIIYHISRDYQTKLKYPYYDNEVLNFFLKFNMKELSLPKLKEKWISIYAFKDYFSQYPMFRKHANYQTNAGIQKWHRDVFLNSEYNTKNYREVIFVYQHMFKTIQIIYDS